MIVKSLIVGALALATNPIDFGPTTFTQHPYVEQVFCDEGRGTAFKISTGQWLTVDHVSRGTNCSIDGKPIAVLENDAWGDFSVIAFPDNRKGGIEVNCDGFKDGTWYFGLGHGKGLPIPQIKAVRHSAWMTLIGGRGRWAVLEANRFVPGMSGGPVLDQTGRVVGTVNAFGIFERISFSRPLRETSICSA